MYFLCGNGVALPGFWWISAVAAVASRKASKTDFISLRFRTIHPSGPQFRFTVLLPSPFRHGHHGLFPVHRDFVLSIEHPHRGPALPVGSPRPARPPFVEDQLFVCFRGG